MLPVPDNVIESATFKLCRRGPTDEWFCTGATYGGIHYRLLAGSIFAHATLKSIYTTPEGNYVPSPWIHEYQPAQLFPYASQFKFKKVIWDLHVELTELTKKEWSRIAYPPI